MKTTLFVDPENDHERIVELKRACASFKAKFPNSASELFDHEGQRWTRSANGYGLVVPRTIREVPLFLRGVPIHMIELSDMVEDPRGLNQLTVGIYEVGTTRAEVDSHLSQMNPETYAQYTIYTINIEGTDLGEINDLYTCIRQSRANPTQVWDLVVPTN